MNFPPFFTGNMLIICEHFLKNTLILPKNIEKQQKTIDKQIARCYNETTSKFNAHIHSKEHAMKTSKARRLPLMLSYIFCTLSLLGIIPASVFLPRVVQKYLTRLHPELGSQSGLVTEATILLYVGMAIAAAVLVLLLCLLRVTRREHIFTPVSGRLVFAVACLVIAEGGIFILLAHAMLPIFSLAVTAVAVVLGCCLMVVSHILTEAAAIKAENDATI